MQLLCQGLGREQIRHIPGSPRENRHSVDFKGDCFGPCVRYRTQVCDRGRTVRCSLAGVIDPGVRAAGGPGDGPSFWLHLGRCVRFGSSPGGPR